MSGLVLRNGRVLDPGRNFDQRADILFQDGRVAAIGPGLSVPAGTVAQDVGGRTIVPGLIDLHAHVYWGGTSLGIDAVPIARRSGTTTFIDAGSAGPGIFHGFRRFIIEPSPVRILAYLNLSFPGIYAFSKSVMIGECADIELLDLRECRRVADENRDLIVGIKVRVGRHAGGNSGIMPLDMALEVADAVDMPVMCHLDYAPPSRLEVVSRLRRGDVLTHCFRPFPNAPVHYDGRIWEDIQAARERGVIFDIGHGGGSFGFRTAEAMLEAGFEPDVISSDVHAISMEGPAYDLLFTLSKFLSLGMSLEAVIRCATAAPAHAVGRPELGRLEPGGIGDATVLEVENGRWTYSDVLGENRIGTKRLSLGGMVVAGQWFETTPEVPAVPA
ncbi:MAG TPA: amidohydrolase/deacetylase family metallohydrolase [Stellaceae bacterium]|nr:amidohydrolase/deacetylase family metallohydrolase [Stellaceae bacterium]